MLNDNETIVWLTCSSRAHLSESWNDLVNTIIAYCEMHFSNKVNKLGTHFGHSLSRTNHVNTLISLMCLELRVISKISHFISTYCVAPLVTSSSLLTLYYGNFLFTGLPNEEL